MSRRSALIIALFGLLAVSHAVIFIRMAGDAPALILAATRVLVATLVFAPFAGSALLRSGRTAHPSFQMIALSILSGLFLALHFAAWIESVQRLTIAESAILVSLSPIWIALIEAMLGRGKPARGVVIGITLCLIGLVIIGWNGISNPAGDPVGMALAVLGGISVAAYLVIGKRVRQDLSTSVYVTLCYGCASLSLILLGVVLAVPVAGLPFNVWLAALALGLVSQVGGHTAYNHALARLSPIFVAICLLGEPILGSLLGLVYLGETIPMLTLLGGVPILIGLWWAIRAELTGAKQPVE